MWERKTGRIALAAVFAAIIYVFTAYLHIPHWTGYIHIGDGVLYLAAAMLPKGYAAASGAIGAGLADILSGYAMWAPGTVVIKAVTVCFFTSKEEKIMCPRNYLALLPSLAVCTGGYYVYESLVSGNWGAAAAGIPGYLTQSVLSAVFFIAVGISLDKMKVKGRIG